VKRSFLRGDPAASIYFVQTGRIKITVVSAAGKEAVLAMPGPHDFFGEGSLVKQAVRVSTAETLESSIVFRVEKRAMIRSLHEQSDLSEKFMAALLTRNIDIEEDLCDQLFNHSEKRLARVLLKLARLREHDVVQDANIPVLSHEILAEMVGTTRSRITHFMNKFRTMGLIEYNGELVIRTELLTDLVLHDSAGFSPAVFKWEPNRQTFVTAGSIITSTISVKQNIFPIGRVHFRSTPARVASCAGVDRTSTSDIHKPLRQTKH
jgi:CRP/FNR family cyclic AMP-dependent transcriptional regulator